MKEWEGGSKIRFLEYIPNDNSDPTYPFPTSYVTGDTNGLLILNIKRTTNGGASVGSSWVDYYSGGLITHRTYNDITLFYDANAPLGEYPGLQTNIVTNGLLITNGCIIKVLAGEYRVEPILELSANATVTTNVEKTSYASNVFNAIFRHEFGHVLGFPHEHEKWNRNDYLDFNLNHRPEFATNPPPIIPKYRTWTTTHQEQTSPWGCGFLWLEPCYRTVTDHHESGSGMNLIDGFDYESIMMYDVDFYIKNTTNIIIVPGYVSPKDKQAVNLFYP